MTWKKNNPGRPCCADPTGCPCACYPFDGSGKDRSVNRLHLSQSSEAYSTTKKLGTKSATFAAGTSSFSRPPHDCFNPGDGINIWWWIYRTPPSSGGSTTHGGPIEYIITKGLFADQTKAHSATPNDGKHPGSYTIWIDPDEDGSTSDMFIMVMVESGDIGDLVGAKTYESSAAWVFFFWWWEPAAISADIGRMSLIRNGTTVVDEKIVAGHVGNPYRKSDDETLYIGKHLGADKSETIYIDNVGFCKNIGTKDEMTARAAKLYNSGDGLPCNSAGFE